MEVIVSLECPDKEGHYKDIVLGKASAEYEKGHPYLAHYRGSLEELVMQNLK